MRRFLLFLSISIASLYVLATDAQAQSVLITYKTEAQLQQLQSRFAATISYETLKEVQVVTANLKKEEIEELQTSDPQLIIETNRQVTILNDAMTEKTVEELPWNLQLMRVSTAWDAHLTGKNVKIALIDTGVNQLSSIGKIKKQLSFNSDDESTPINEADSIDRGHDNKGHGTSVAAIITAKQSNAKVKGIAPDAEIYALKYTDGTKKGEVANLIKAINWSIENKMDIINISSGLSSDVTALHTAVQRAVKQGILIVASAGNDGQLAPTIYPAHYEEVISVGSINQYKDVSSFSNAANPVTFTAPGEDILTYNHAGIAMKMSGTSYAAPHITAFLAVLKERYPYSSAQFLVKKAAEQTTLHQTPYFQLTAIPALSTMPLATVSTVKAHQITVHLPTKKTSEYLIYLNNRLVTRTTKKTYVLRNLVANTQQKLSIRFVGANGNWSKEKILFVKTKIDRKPPDAPKQFTAQLLPSKFVKLAWKQNKPSDFSKNIIYENGVKIATIKGNDFITKNKLKKNKLYEYKIIAVDTTGNRSHTATVKVIRYK